MDDFADALRQRVREARAAIEVALEAEDPYGVAVAQDDLDDALRIAGAHGVDVDPDSGAVDPRAQAGES
ncbi:hypothetical protein [Actinacidiphila glaucinigra]|uniref:hypothetical protein n=1 Tax=Actinacidiphila glaucinigra TaxID=235986 RepID=UPI0035D57A9A